MRTAVIVSNIVVNIITADQASYPVLERALHAKLVPVEDGIDCNINYRYENGEFVNPFAEMQDMEMALKILCEVTN